jgi:steroid delta-isomerase-like uncharacterized protein
MSQQNKAIVRRYFEEAWVQGKLDVLDEILTPDFSLQGPPFKPYTGIEAAKKDLEISQSGYKDTQVNIKGIIAEGDIVAVWFTFTGTHTGETLGIPPSGKKVTISGLVWFRLANGKIAEAFFGMDSLGWCQEVGLVPQMEKLFAGEAPFL